MVRNRVFAVLLCGLMLCSTGIAVHADDGGQQVPEQITGDLTGDGVMNVVDVIVMQKFILGRLKLPHSLILNIDFNDDGAVNAFDLAVLKRMVTDS
ncbi:MAG: hypothetical protein E7504_08470 [Ruminococcus sp.]|nr:hypothetical protein [Ruminococcus sp.]